MPSALLIYLSPNSTPTDRSTHYVTAKVSRRFRRWYPLQQQNSWWKTRKVVEFGWNNIGDDGDVERGGLVEEISEVWIVKVV